jgi:hypothetical protein
MNWLKGMMIGLVVGGNYLLVGFDKITYDEAAPTVLLVLAAANAHLFIKGKNNAD